MPRPMPALLVVLSLVSGTVSLPSSPRCPSCFSIRTSPGVRGGTISVVGPCPPLSTPVSLTAAHPFCLVSRRCTIRTATGTTPASAVPSACTPWPMRLLCPRTTRSCATSAPLGRTPPSARAASSQLWQVLPYSLLGWPGRRPVGRDNVGLLGMMGLMLLGAAFSF